jgi:hypothetical protein
MKTLLTVNLTTKTASAGDEAWTPPSFRFGEEVILALRFTEDRAGVSVEPELDVAALRAAIGRVDARPESGKFALQFGDGAQTVNNTIDPVAWDASPGALQAAIAAKTAVTGAYGAPVVTKQDDTWRIVFGTGTAEVPIVVRDNTLFPVSFAHVEAYQIDGVWLHFVRLMQAEVAFTSSSEAVLPEAPTIALVGDGGSEGDFEWNEVQRLHVPPDFRGSYILRYGDDGRTAQLTVDDGIEQIQAALEAMLGAGNVSVTASLNFSADIEFTGDLAATNVELLEVEVLAAPAGDITFTLGLDRAELATILRRVESVTLPLQVWLTLNLDDDETQEVTAFTANVTIQRPLIWPEQATIVPVDWLRPPSTKDYKLQGDATFTGDKSMRFTVGNGSATSFACDHNFATDDVEIWVRETASNGYELRNGTDYRVRITNANTVTVTSLVGAPATGAWAIYVRTAEPIAAFAAGLTVTIDQVTGLQDFLDNLGGRVTDIEELLPGGTPISTAEVEAASSTFKRLFPAFRLEAPPLSRSAGIAQTSTVPAAIKETTSSDGAGSETTFTGTRVVSSTGDRLRYFPLSPLVTAASVEGSPKSNVQLDYDAAEEGKVYSVSGSAVTAVRRAGRELLRFADGDNIAFKNGHWFKVRGTSGAWWATECEADLFVATMSADMWAVGKQWQIKFEPTMVIASKTKVTGRCLLTLQTGTYTSLASATDFASLAWTDAASALIALSDLPTPAIGWGALDRTGSTAISGTFRLAGKTANFTGSTANMAVRLRVSEFDFARSDAKGSFIVALDGAYDTLVPIKS